MNAVTRTVGGSFGGAAVASILAASVGGGGFPSAHGFTVAFAACAVALALGVGVGLAIPQRRPADAFVRPELAAEGVPGGIAAAGALGDGVERRRIEP